MADLLPARARLSPRMHWRNRRRVRRRASGRYIESDPILQPSRDVIDGQWVFAVPYLIKKIRLLLPYAYVADQPTVGSDPRGLIWPIDLIKCMYYSNKYLNAAQECRRRSGSCSREQINFMTAYQAPSLTGAVLHCACLNAGPDVCKNMWESCGNTGNGAPQLGDAIFAVCPAFDPSCELMRELASRKPRRWCARSRFTQISPRMSSALALLTEIEMWPVKAKQTQREDKHGHV
jgi:hypothetical protein